MGKGEKYELAKSDKFLLIIPCWVDKTKLLLPISTIRVISGDNPLLLLEMRGFKDMKKKIKNLGKIELHLILRLPFPGLSVFSNTYVLFNYYSRAFKLS
jgi:hypothetical protein